MPSNKPVDVKKSINYAALKDRNILVTGGASGFGKAFVHMFAEHGANIVVADIQDGLGRQVEKEVADKGGKIKFVHVDITSFDSQVLMVKEALDFFPRNEIDIFMPNAGILEHPTQIDPQDPADLAKLTKAPADISGRIIDINLKGVFAGVMLVARYGMGLHKAPEGGPRPPKAIILTASLAGYCGAEGSVEYTATKFGVRGILRGFRKQMATLGVRLNAIAPFYVDTPMTTFAMPVLRQAGIPVSTVEHVVEAAARLATDDDAWGRSVFVMPEGLTDGGDDSAGGQGGKAFSTEAFGEHWSMLIDGPMSDNIVA